MKNFLGRVGLLGSLFCSVAGGALYYLLFTTSGCQFLVQTLAHLSEQTFQVHQVAGHLGESLYLAGVDIEQGEATLHVKQIELDVEFGKLLRGEVYVHSLLLSGVDLCVAQQRPGGEPQQAFTLPAINVPVPLVIERFQLQDAVFSQDANGEQNTRIDQFHARIESKKHTLKVQSALLNAPLYGAAGEILLHMQDAWQVELKGNWQVVPPGCHQVDGRITLSGSLNNPQFTLQVLHPQEITLSGTVDTLPADPTFTIHGAAHAFDPSLLCSSAPKLSIDADFIATGRPALFEVSGQTLLSHEQFGQLEGQVQFAGNTQGITVEEGTLSHKEGVFTLSGQLGWQDFFSWDLDIHAQDLNPADYLLAGKGHIGGRLHTTGKWGEEKNVAIELTEVNGSYNGLEVTGQGKGGWKDGRLVIDELLLKNGENNLTVQAMVTDNYQLVLEGSIPDIGVFLPDTTGSIQLRGRVSGEIDRPVLQLQAGLQDFTGHEVRFDHLSSELDLALYGENRFEITGFLEGGRVAGQALQKVEFKANGTQTHHQISGFVQSDLGNTDFTAAGGVDNDLLWQGTLQSMALHHAEYGSWNLAQQTSIYLSPQKAAIEPLCFAAIRGTVCLEGTWQKDGAWQLAFPTAELELMEWADVLPVSIRGQVTGHLLAQGNGMAIQTFSGSLVTEEVRLPYQDQLRNQDSISGSGQLQFELDETALQIDLQVEEAMGGVLAGSCCIADFTNLTYPLSSHLLDGTFALNSGDIRWLEELYSDMLVSGALKADITLTGQLAAPLLTADFMLHDGNIQFPLLGSRLSGLQGKLTRAADGTLTLTTSANSGDGVVQGTGDIRFDKDHWQGNAHVQGRNIKLLDKEELRLWGDPYLDFAFSQRGGHLSGTIRIPQADIYPEQSIKRETVSGDVVFVDAVRQEPGWPVTYDIDVRLGDAVVVEGYGFKGYLDGDLQLISPEQGDMVLGTGLFIVRDGTFTLRGSQMQVNQGRLVFNGSPVNNPELDIELRKKVEPQNIGGEPTTVGFDISGSALNYQVELSSTPAMEDKEILTYILFDRSMDQGDEDSSDPIILSALESMGFGQTTTLINNVIQALPPSLTDMQFSSNSNVNRTSIGVRKKMTDDLSIYYDFNLFKSAGRFRVVYQLARGFSLEATNTAEANGIRLLYSFER